MKKQYFIYSVITCMLVIFNVKAQNTPIDDFLKKYPSREGVTHVSMSQQMLQSLFSSNTFFKNAPEAYSSVSVSKTDKPATLFADFKKSLLFFKYEQVMEVNKEESDIITYYMKKLDNATNEIVVLRQQKNLFSAIYIKGIIDMSNVHNYLHRIKVDLDVRNSFSMINIQPDHQFAFAISSFDEFKFPNNQNFDFRFNSDSIKFKMYEDLLQMRIEESMKEMKDKFKNME